MVFDEFKRKFSTVCDPEPDPELILLVQDELDASEMNYLVLTFRKEKTNVLVYF